MNWKTVYRIIFFLWVGIVGVLSVIPSPDKVVAVPDKFAHFVAYFITVSLCYCAFKREKLSFLVFLGIAVFLYGIAIEVVQYFLPYRDFSIGDIIANASGIGTFFVIWGVYSRTVRQKRGRLK
ncbi:hypothetical protein MNBD_NITROSPIRAE03-1402 [hydrothermal vent metagenome]|uniref:VanZ-like domain-containing protein n=1 Tax=hydrothermal vent metagenome TaxID=652676 RepID=A0A3B1DFC6_9ZZZZ